MRHIRPSIESGGDYFFDREEYEFETVVADEFVIKLQIWDEPVEYIFIKMREEAGKHVIEKMTVISKHSLDCPLERAERNAEMRYIFYSERSKNNKEYCFAPDRICNAATIIYDYQGREMPEAEWKWFTRSVDFWYVKAVMAILYFSDKINSQEKVFADIKSRTTGANREPGNSLKNYTGNKVIKIDDVKIVYPSSPMGERTITRHTLSWHVRGHLGHLKSGKTIAVKPYIKGDKSVPVKNKTYKIS